MKALETGQVNPLIFLKLATNLEIITRGQEPVEGQREPLIHAHGETTARNRAMGLPLNGRKLIAKATTRNLQFRQMANLRGNQRKTDRGDLVLAVLDPQQAVKGGGEDARPTFAFQAIMPQVEGLRPRILQLNHAVLRLMNPCSIPLITGFLWHRVVAGRLMSFTGQKTGVAVKKITTITIMIDRT